MLTLLLFLFGFNAPQGMPAAGSQIYVSGAEIAEALKKSRETGTVDQLLRSVDVPGGRVSVALLHRQKAEVNSLAHDRVTEIYQIVEGAGTLVTGGQLGGAKPVDLERLGAGPSRSGEVQGGDTRRVGPKDVIFITAGTPHRFSALDGPLVYLVYRFDPSPGAKPK